MASPQVENGYTQIANELLEKLGSFSFLGSEFQVIFCVIRKTYGFHKKEDIISLTQFEKFTGLSRPTVVSVLKNLTGNRVLIKNKNLWSLNKDWEKWGSKARLTSKAVLTRTSKHRLTETSKARLTYKRNKEIKKRDSSKEESLSTNKNNTMRYYDEETGEYGDSKELKKETPKNKLALNAIKTFSEMCNDKINTRPLEAKGNYFLVLQAVKVLNEDELLRLMKDWFESGKEKQDLIQITQCFSINNINRFRTK